MTDFVEIEGYLESNRVRFLDDLKEWLRFPSIGTDPKFDLETRKAGEWIAEQFRKLNLQTEIIETNGHPLVFAESPKVPNAPTVLIYGHYDVQPPDPLELWDSPPFEPDVRDGKIFARGATDNKGQMITHLFAVESVLKSNGALPLQVKFLIEGEEESGGKGLSSFLQGQFSSASNVRQKLAADVCVISDCSQFGPGQPAITYGLRGNVHFQLDIRGPERDLHSGAFGGAVTNPANAICQMLDLLDDFTNEIALEGFYDQVKDLTDAERMQLRTLDFSETEFLNDIGATELNGEVGYSPLERRWCRPTFDIHGMWSGYQAEGVKTVLPATAGAKFSFRLVPNQDPETIKQLVRDHMKRACPPGIEFTLTASAGASGICLPVDDPFVLAAKRAIKQGFGVDPVFIRSGGTIPVVNRFRMMPGVNALLLGWGQDDDNLHSPNEKLSIDDFYLGIKSSCYLLYELAKISC